MNLLINIIQRFTQNPKTTAGGLLGGGVISAAVAMILEQAGCQLSHVQWWEVMGTIFGGGTIMGGLATDNGGTVKPVAIPPAVS